MNFDRDPVFIHISANNKDTLALANLNAITKWPLYFQVSELDKQFDIDLQSTNKIELRNKFVKNYDRFFPSSHPLDFQKEFDYKENVMEFRRQYETWYNLRNSNNPHEVNESHYVKPKTVPDHFYNIDLMEIYKDGLADKLSKIMKDSQSGNFDFNYVKDFHKNYVDTQTNLKLIQELTEFRITNKVTSYLTSHPLIEALVIRELLNKLPNGYNWEQETLQEIVKVIQSQ
jgi:hypothetical protein